MTDEKRAVGTFSVASGDGAYVPVGNLTELVVETRASEVDSPSHYTSGGMETIDKIESVVDGLDGIDAYLLGNVVKYVDRAGMKAGTSAQTDLEKANNYAHRLSTGEWR